MMTEQSARVHKFEAEVSQVMRLVINSLYSNKEIFLRELISNAADALDKVRFRALTETDLLGEDTDLRVRVSTDPAAHTITFEDNGVGMTDAELTTNLGTIAHSGTRAFLDAAKNAQGAGDMNLIGQFGVGFYSAFLVADKVEVISRAAGSDQAWRWTSDATDTFTIEPAERAQRGTTITLHLKEDQREWEEGWRLRDLIQRYADFIHHKIEMPVPVQLDEDEENPVIDAETAWEQVNAGNALWQRSPSDITDEQYQECYRHVSHDWEPSLTHTHFTIEGTQQFKGLLFIPRRAPFDLFDPDAKRGVRLYVKRVFILEDARELMPPWLRFVRGIIDSDDLPLNVSRELLQDSRLVKTIRKQAVKKVLTCLEELAEQKAEEYDTTFWPAFGTVLKEGLHYDRDLSPRLAKLARYASSTQPGLTSLASYIERMPEGQPAIYYALGASRALLESSPHLEGLKKRGYEVLYMTDAIDQWAMQGMGDEFEGKKLVSATGEALDLPESDAEKEHKEAQKAEFKGLVEAVKGVLDNRVGEVRVSERLADSPVCLVVPEGGLNAHIERMLRANGQDLPSTKRILEVNPDHTLIKHLNGLFEREPGSQQANEWIEMLYDQALLTEGSPIDDPGAFARRMTRMMETAAAQLEQR
jgi:molecular chaperone HtpG